MAHLKEELDTALAAVREAAGFAESVRAAGVDRGTMIKSDCSPVTIADFGVQAIVHRRLGVQFPDDPIVAEEDADELEQNAGLMEDLLGGLNSCGSGGWGPELLIEQLNLGGHQGGPDGRFWALDPVDGTKGFIRGEQYAIALALIQGGTPVLGVLGCPFLEMKRPDGRTEQGWILAAADDGAQAFSISGDVSFPVRVRDVSRTEDIRMCESVESGHSSHGTSAQIALALGIHLNPVRMDSQAKYAAVAAGMADAYLRLPTGKSYREKIWDHAAGAHVLQEAGGRISDVLGHPLDFSRGRTLKQNRGVVATAAGVHEAVISAVRPHYTAMFEGIDQP